jgi:diacylglycerol O-acyltransferase / wax synthase
MENQIQADRLSWGDTVFLHLEREGMPLNVACVCVFEGEIPFKACVKFVESKLSLIPRYLKRVVPQPFGIGLPSWEYDAKFDIHNHVREVTLKHGSDAELKGLAGKILSKVMDRQRPLWDITLVHGLKGDRSGFIFRLHHCLADGIAGVGIMNKIMDATPVVPRLPRRKLQLPVPPPPPDVLSAVTNGCIDSYSDLVKRTFDAITDVSSMAERAAANGGNLSKDEFTHLLPEFSLSTERLRFNVLYRGPQKFAWADLPLGEIKVIRHICGTSVNDVILALVTATIRRYLELHGERVQGRMLRMMVPVNLRGTEGPGELGNRISLVPVSIPLDVRNPRKLLATVLKRTELLKRAHTAELVSLAGGLISMVPSSAQALVGHILSRLPFTPFNMVCTNVPGPQSPLYLLGHKMLHCYPYVPVGGEMGLNCAIFTYNGTAYFGFSGEVHAAPDLRRLEEFLRLSFTELREGAGVHTPRKEAGIHTLRKKEEKKKRNRVSAKPKVALTGAPAPAPVQPSIPIRPLASVKPSIASEPPVKEEGVTRLIA